MADIFVNQSKVTITLETGVDLTAATAYKILYHKPSNVKGFWIATVSGTKLVYNISPGDLNETGIWRFQAFTTIGGLDSYGSVAEQTILPNLAQ